MTRALRLAPLALLAALLCASGAAAMNFAVCYDSGGCTGFAMCGAVGWRLQASTHSAPGACSALPTPVLSIHRAPCPLPSLPPADTTPKLQIKDGQFANARAAAAFDKAITFATRQLWRSHSVRNGCKLDGEPVIKQVRAG